MDRTSHILIIDDNPVILEMMKFMLELEGAYQVTTSCTLFKQARDVECLHPDLIVLDLYLQGRQTSWPFLQCLKMHPATGAIPIIICTAISVDIEVLETIFPRMDISILYKPFKANELLYLVRKRLSSSQ